MKNREKKLENIDFLKKKKIFHDKSFSTSISRIIIKFQQNWSETKKKSSNLGRAPLMLFAIATNTWASNPGSTVSQTLAIRSRMLKKKDAN